MAFQIDVFLLMFFLILTLAWLWRHGWPPLQPLHFKTETVRTTVHRLLSPRTPDDCPVCRLASTASSGGSPAPGLVRRLSRGEKSPRSPSLASTPKGMLVPTRSANTAGSLMLTCMRSLAMARMAVPSASRRFEVLLVAPPESARRDTPFYRLKTPSRAGLPWCSVVLCGALWCSGR